MYSVHSYGQMLADAPRMDAHVAALRRAVKPGSVVLDLGCGPGVFALLACQLKSDDAREIGLKGENLQVEHQLRMVGEGCGNTHGPLDIGRIVVFYGLFGALDLTLHLSNTIEVLIEPHAIGSADALLESCYVFRE